MKPFLSFGMILFLLCADGYAQPGDDIGYPTVRAALDALRGDPAARFSFKDGWTIVEVNDGDDEVVWSFTPRDHPAHPAVVRRTMAKRGDEVSVDTRVRCEAASAPCDRLFEEFVRISEQIPPNLKKNPANPHWP